MAAGVFGYLGYDMVRQMEAWRPPRRTKIGARRRHAAPTVMVVFDSVRDELCVVTRRPARAFARVAHEAALARLEKIAVAGNPVDHRESDMIRCCGSQARIQRLGALSRNGRTRQEYIRAGIFFRSSFPTLHGAFRSGAGLYRACAG